MYVCGQMQEMSFIQDVNHMSCMDISKLIKSSGYSDFKSLYYRHPKLALGHELRPLNCDDYVLKFANDVKGHEVIEVCVEHLFDTYIEVYEVKGKRKAFDEEVVIDLEDEYEGDSEDDSEDKEYVTSSDNVSDDYTEDDSDFEANYNWATVLPQETINEVCSNVGSIENVVNLDPIMNLKFEVEDEDEDSDILATPREVKLMSQLGQSSQNLNCHRVMKALCLSRTWNSLNFKG
jgi:hypothetical protein